MRILVIDDEDTFRDTLSEVLREEGYLVSIAIDGKDALRQIEETRFDLALCDVVITGIDGMDVLKAIRYSSPSTYVVMMTAFGTKENAIETMKQGAVDYISKPFDFDDLLLKLKKILEKKVCSWHHKEEVENPKNRI